MDAITVMLAEDDPGIRALMSHLIESDDSFRLVGVAEDAAVAIDVALRQTPDVALVDVEMPKGGGPRATRGIRMCSPQTKVVALSAHRHREAVLEMLRAGAAGYVVKGTPLGEILETIRRTALGHSTLSPEVAGEVIDALSGRLRREGKESREHQERSSRIRDFIDGRVAFAMAFQPIFDLQSRHLVGVEALARFPSKPVRRPDEWFLEAESVGLRNELEIAAVRAGLAAMGKIPDGAYLSLNLSPDVACSSDFGQILDGAPANRLVIEITEHARVDDYETLGEFVAGLRGAGARLAIDDAGAGFASMRHIIRLVPDIIKIDVDLTHHVETDQARRALAAHLIAFAADIGSSVVAEGIETPGQLDALRDLGVRYGQGYHLARPGPLEQVVRLERGA